MFNVFSPSLRSFGKNISFLTKKYEQNNKHRGFRMRFAIVRL